MSCCGEYSSEKRSVRSERDDQRALEHGTVNMKQGQLGHTIPLLSGADYPRKLKLAW
jgi:hypothetical protein